MTLFALYRSRTDAAAPPVAVGERFSWFAALLPPVHALAHRLWGQLALFVAGVAGIAVLDVYLEPNLSFWLYLLLALAFGFGAPGARRRALLRRGYAPAGYRFAPDEDLARVALLEAGS